MDFGIGSIIGISVYTYVMFKIGRSYGYKAARDDLKNNGKLNDSDDWLNRLKATPLHIVIEGDVAGCKASLATFSLAKPQVDFTDWKLVLSSRIRQRLYLIFKPDWSGTLPPSGNPRYEFVKDDKGVRGTDVVRKVVWELPAKFAKRIRSELSANDALFANTNEACSSIICESVAASGLLVIG